MSEELKRAILSGEETDFETGMSLGLFNFGAIHAELYDRQDQLKKKWPYLQKVKIWDCSLSEPETSGHTIYRAIPPRGLVAHYKDGELQVFELEISAIPFVPP